MLSSASSLSIESPGALLGVSGFESTTVNGVVSASSPTGATGAAGAAGETEATVVMEKAC